MKHTELIERLRAGSGGMKHWQELESEAADAIEALQSTLARIEKKVDYLIAERDALKLDAERLQRVTLVLSEGWTSLPPRLANQINEAMKGAAV
jgi:regulator of replication initiation timing